MFTNELSQAMKERIHKIGSSLPLSNLKISLPGNFLNV